jgi:hypothetical protein
MEQVMKFQHGKLTWRKVCIFIFIVAVAVLGFSLWLRLMLPSIKQGEVTRLDTEAKQLVYSLADHLPKTGLPEDRDCVLFGEKADRYIMVYCGDVFQEDTVLTGTKSSKHFAYWAARISGQNVMAVWYSAKPLASSDLHIYTDADRFDMMRLQNPLSWPISGYLDISDVIGYAAADISDEEKSHNKYTV